MKVQENVNNFCGTPTYMSPELIMKNAHNPQKADLWALGVLIFTVLQGRPPF